MGEFASNSVSATFVNRNNFGTFAVIGLLANVAVYTRSSSSDALDPARRLRDFLEGFFSGHWVFAIGTLICLAAIFFSESRAGFAAALVGLAIFSATGRRKNAGSIYATTFVGLIVALSLLAFSSGTFTRMFAAGGDEARFLIYPLVLDGILDRPLLGHGLGAFHDAFRAYVSPELSFREIDLAHSSYLENLFELGIPAGVAFYFALLTIVFVIYRGVKRRVQNQRFPRFAFATAMAVGFHAFFDFSLQIPAIAALFAFVLGLGWAQSFSGQNKDVPSGTDIR
ncbi:MAG: O-antigen ligase family protein [Boseongicola sp.]|nr:O-antigen ligase family protein [Boseongicola sp.]